MIDNSVLEQWVKKAEYWQKKAKELERIMGHFRETAHEMAKKAAETSSLAGAAGFLYTYTSQIPCPYVEIPIMPQDNWILKSNKIENKVGIEVYRVQIEKITL